MNNSSKNLSHIAPVFRVVDLARSLAYYREKLGFEEEFNYENFYASVVRDGCHIHLQCAPPAQRDQAAFELKEHLDACVVVGNAKELEKRFAAAGATFTVRRRQMPYGTEFYMRDPDGYILGFVEPAAE
jgi:catechol 2,3-dioxygenase-like lactoylglutathione lyase family enzyme